MLKVCNDLFSVFFVSRFWKLINCAFFNLTIPRTPKGSFCLSLVKHFEKLNQNNVTKGVKGRTLWGSNRNLKRCWPWMIGHSMMRPNYKSQEASKDMPFWWKMHTLHKELTRHTTKLPTLRWTSRLGCLQDHRSKSSIG